MHILIIIIIIVVVVVVIIIVVVVIIIVIIWIGLPRIVVALLCSTQFSVILFCLTYFWA